MARARSQRSANLSRVALRVGACSPGRRCHETRLCPTCARHHFKRAVNEAYQWYVKAYGREWPAWAITPTMPHDGRYDAVDRWEKYGAAIGRLCEYHVKRWGVPLDSHWGKELDGMDYPAWHGIAPQLPGVDPDEWVEWMEDTWFRLMGAHIDIGPVVNLRKWLRYINKNLKRPDQYIVRQAIEGQRTRLALRSDMPAGLEHVNRVGRRGRWGKVIIMRRAAFTGKDGARFNHHHSRRVMRQARYWREKALAEPWNSVATTLAIELSKERERLRRLRPDRAAHVDRGDWGSVWFYQMPDGAISPAWWVMDGPATEPGSYPERYEVA